MLANAEETRTLLCKLKNGILVSIAGGSLVFIASVALMIAKRKKIAKRLGDFRNKRKEALERRREQQRRQRDENTGWQGGAFELTTNDVRRSASCDGSTHCDSSAASNDVYKPWSHQSSSSLSCRHCYLS